MDDPKLGLYLDSKSGSTPAWTWKLLLQGEKIAGGKSPGTQETAFAAARETLGAKKESAVPTYAEVTQPLAVFGQCSRQAYCTQLFKNPSAVDPPSSDRSPVMPPSECVSGVLASELDGRVSITSGLP
jgi:hypothetical protein